MVSTVAIKCNTHERFTPPHLILPNVTDIPRCCKSQHSLHYFVTFGRVAPVSAPHVLFSVVPFKAFLPYLPVHVCLFIATLKRRKHTFAKTTCCLLKSIALEKNLIISSVRSADVVTPRVRLGGSVFLHSPPTGLSLH